MARGEGDISRDQPPPQAWRWTAPEDAAAGAKPPSLLRRSLRMVRVQLLFWWCHGRIARLARPLRLTDHIQRRKLGARDARFAMLSDKVAVKALVAAALGEGAVIPLWWHGTALPPVAPWPMPFVVKARHGCGQFRVVHNAGDYAAARADGPRWMARGYGRWLDEYAYAEIARGLLVEPYIGEGSALPVDYKLFVFGGRVEYVQCHLDRATAHRWIVFDRHWVRQSPATGEANPPRPAALAEMIVAAERIGGDFDFVRADFYEVAGRVLFGELTFFPGSGLERVEPAELDQAMGARWNAARARMLDSE